MSKKVICINDQNLPDGAYVMFDMEYVVEKEYINALDQRVYVIKGAVNEGTTKWGMRWMGYNATRFKEVEYDYVESYEHNYMLN
jgi:hypothetical protein